MTLAEDALVNPTDDLRAMVAELRRLSADSESVSRSDLEFEDDSVLVVTSRQGGECMFQAKESMDERDDPELMA